MLGVTHLAVGMGAALTLAQPTTLGECFTAAIGGAVGGVLADVDTMKNDTKFGATQVQAFAAVLTASLLILDSLLKSGVWAEIRQQSDEELAMGGILFGILWLMGYFSNHRSFTHSLGAMLLFTWTVSLVCPSMSMSFLIGYASHLVLDLLNKRPLKLFYPLDRGVCFGVFYSNREADKLCMYAGWLLTAWFAARLWIPR